jgi:hypothetical protein
MTASTSRELLAQLRKASGTANASAVLQQLSESALTRPAFVAAYHEQLLFLKAFPFNENIRKATVVALANIASSGKTASPFLYAGLCGDGIANTELICSYSLELTSWLFAKFPDSVILHSSGADAETVRKTIQLLCPFAEFEKATQGELSLGQRITALTGQTHARGQLQWLLNSFAESGFTSLVKEELFRRLQVYVQWKMNVPEYSRTFLQFDTGKYYFQKAYIKNVNSKQLIRQKILYPEKLTKLKKKQLCDTIKTSLALYCRETDPSTYADEDAIQLFHMGRGFSIALLYMQKEKRLSLDSYIGYMAFKNGVPVSYGGGWIFGYRCKIGVNIYPPFRKGESKWMFCQILRLYHQHFNISCFTVNPYQFGKDNAEGLRSGAFWFYYRLGFKPVHDEAGTLAGTEWKKISHDKQYHSPLHVLKKLAESPVSLVLSAKNTPAIDAPDISKAISSHINQFYNSSRREALTAGFLSLKKHFGISLHNETLALLCLMANKKTRLTEREKTKLMKLYWQKTNGDERDYITGIQNCPGFWKLAGSAIRS